MTIKSCFNIALGMVKPHIIKNKGQYYLQLLSIWREVTPLTWHNYTVPSQFKWLKNEKAVLMVKCTLPSKALELNFDTPMVIQNINIAFGHNFVTKITFTS